MQRSISLLLLLSSLPLASLVCSVAAEPLDEPELQPSGQQPAACAREDAGRAASSSLSPGGECSEDVKPTVCASLFQRADPSRATRQQPLREDVVEPVGEEAATPLSLPKDGHGKPHGGAAAAPPRAASLAADAPPRAASLAADVGAHARAATAAAASAAAPAGGAAASAVDAGAPVSADTQHRPPHPQAGQRRAQPPPPAHGQPSSLAAAFKEELPAPAGGGGIGIELGAVAVEPSAGVGAFHNEQAAAAQPGEPRHSAEDTVLAAEASLQRHAQELAQRARRRVAEGVHYVRTGSGSTIVLAGIFLGVSVLCLIWSICAYASATNSKSGEPRPMHVQRADIFSMQGPRASSSAAPRAPAPQNPSMASLKSYPEKPMHSGQSAPAPETPVRFASMESAQHTAAALNEQQEAVEGAHLCPELVVPEDSECTLMIPRATSINLGSEPVYIFDMRGVKVFKVVFSPAPLRGGNRRKQDNKRLVLSSISGDEVFAFCKSLDSDPSGQAGLAIYSQAEALFGEMRADGPRPAMGYSVVTRRGWRARFHGTPEDSNLYCKDEQGRLLVLTEVSGTRRSVRIGPLVDAGLMAICILGIDLLGQGFPESQRL